ncbi:hypothetical protein HB884_07945 [Listeria booriae]|uniref:hypothetical protein n=1 Tax=Listeria booriae TaxID=1552123 RepID=UPI001627D7E0|nr:hypothetical protein [Listeria booriae]MBC1524137.1 hypothetical protein [Listeria booriae]
MDNNTYILNLISSRRMGVQHMISSLLHTEYMTADEVMELDDEEIEACYNQMRAESD